MDPAADPSRATDFSSERSASSHAHDESSNRGLSSGVVIPLLTDAQLSSLLDDVVNPYFSLDQVARDHAVSLDALAALLARPDVAARLAAIASAAASRARLLATLQLPRAVAALSIMLADADHAERNHPVGQSLPALALRERQRQNARRAANLLLRIAKFSPTFSPCFTGRSVGVLADDEGSSASRSTRSSPPSTERTARVPAGDEGSSPTRHQTESPPSPPPSASSGYHVFFTPEPPSTPPPLPVPNAQCPVPLPPPLSTHRSFITGSNIPEERPSLPPPLQRMFTHDPPNRHPPNPRPPPRRHRRPRRL